MGRLKQLQPEVMTIRETYAGDQRKISEEVMALYRQNKVNPLSGCMPILLQIPVFFALYKVLFITIEMRQAPFFGWIKDLSAPDPLGLLTAFGLIDWTVPTFISFLNIGIWPIIMGGTMWLQQKLNPSPPDPIQQKIFALMPFLFTFLLANFPAGLVIYWSWSNMLSIAQQAFILRRLNPNGNRA
jgi:YidC/Oxa1 family membrane protein insertase